VGASLSIIVPTRNERGNIETLLERLPRMDGAKVEIVFVERHSTDGTWEEILRCASSFRGTWAIKTLRQRGKGKADAVRFGLDSAEGDVLTIFDADLSTPPELLPAFYDAYTSGRGKFVMGNRFVEPMEPGAMRRLNRRGNGGFARIVSWILDMHVGDCLCGTKLFGRADYARLRQWRKQFGELDPFGDFELLFAAVELGLCVVEIPVPYRARTCGRPNIRRFRDGARLARMCWREMRRVKCGQMDRRKSGGKIMGGSNGHMESALANGGSGNRRPRSSPRQEGKAMLRDADG
jgi:glycosyltransferase involved in cell wall biosynthesis